MILNLYTTDEQISKILDGKVGIAYAKRYMNAEHISISVSYEDYLIVKNPSKDLFTIMKHQ